MNGIYDAFKLDLMDGSVDLTSGGDAIKVALYDGTHVFDATHTIYTVTNEISGTGYSAGGETLTGQDVTVATNTATFDATDVQWTASSFTAAHAVIYDVTNTNSLIASIDFGGDQTVSSGTFEIQWNANGIISLT